MRPPSDSWEVALSALAKAEVGRSGRREYNGIHGRYRNPVPGDYARVGPGVLPAY